MDAWKYENYFIFTRNHVIFSIIFGGGSGIFSQYSTSNIQYSHLQYSYSYVRSLTLNIFFLFLLYSNIHFKDVWSHDTQILTCFIFLDLFSANGIKITLNIYKIR